MVLQGSEEYGFFTRVSYLLLLPLRQYAGDEWLAAITLKCKMSRHVLRSMLSSLYLLYVHV